MVGFEPRRAATMPPSFAVLEADRAADVGTPTHTVLSPVGAGLSGDDSPDVGETSSMCFDVTTDVSHSVSMELSPGQAAGAALANGARPGPSVGSCVGGATVRSCTAVPLEAHKLGPVSAAGAVAGGAPGAALSASGTSSALPASPGLDDSLQLSGGSPGSVDTGPHSSHPKRRILPAKVLVGMEVEGGEGDLLTSLMTPITPIRTAPLLFDAGMTRPRSQSRRFGDSPMSTPSLSAPSPRSPIIQAAVPTLMVDGSGHKRSPRTMTVATSLPPLVPITGVPQTTTGSTRSSNRLTEEGPPRLLSMRGPGPGPGAGSRVFGGGQGHRSGPSSVSNPSRLRVAQEVAGSVEGDGDGDGDGETEGGGEVEGDGEGDVLGTRAGFGSGAEAPGGDPGRAEGDVGSDATDAGTGAEASSADGGLGVDGGTGGGLSFARGAPPGSHEDPGADAEHPRRGGGRGGGGVGGSEGSAWHPMPFSQSGGLALDGQVMVTPRLSALDAPGSAQGFVVSEEALKAPKHPLRIIYAAGETFKVCSGRSVYRGLGACCMYPVAAQTTVAWFSLSYHRDSRTRTAAFCGAKWSTSSPLTFLTATSLTTTWPS
jgi:hypothetical protein